MRWSARHIAIVLLIVLGSTSCASSSSFLHGGTEDRKPTDAELAQMDPQPMSEEERASMVRGAAADEIMTFVEGASFPGYGVVAIQEADVVLYWKGDVPDPVARFLDDLRPKYPFKIILAPARYSIAEILAEMKRLMALHPSTSGVPMTGIGPLNDMSGIEIAVEPGHLAMARERVTSSLALRFIEQEAAVPLGSLR